MRSIVKGAALLGALCVMTGSLQAASGLLIVEKTTSGGGAPQTGQIQIEATRMRAESTTMRGERQVVIFDGTKQVLTIIDPGKKTYSELTRADVDQLGSQMSEAMAQMQKQLATLPPEQRAQMEAMIKGRMGGAGIPGSSKIEYRKTGTDTVGKWTCDKYEGYEDGRKTSEVCTVDAKTLGFAESDFAVSKQMADFFSKLVPGAATRMFVI